MSGELTDPAVRRSEQRASEGRKPRTAQPAASPSHPSEQHPRGCRCTRCTGFTPGPYGSAVTRLTHGTRSNVEIQPRAREVAESIRETLVAEQLWRDSFQPTVDACALVLVRLERATTALAQADERLDADGAGPLAAYLGLNGDGADPLARLRADARSWANAARGYLNDLGLTPRAFAAIAKDTGIARSTRAASALRVLAEHVEREHAA